jgi:hypothetical protein
LARAYGLVDADTERDLKMINDVRVVFAHAEVPVRFTSAPVRIKAHHFRGWTPQANARRLFDEAVARAKAVINAKRDELIYEDANRP